MGKSLIQQKRGKGSPRYTASSHNWQGISQHRQGNGEGHIVEFVDCAGHSAPLVKIKYTDGEECLMVAVEGLKAGDKIFAGETAGIGNTITLKDIPEGAIICNIEASPGDGGKFVRASGTFAKLISKTEDAVVVRLPSKKVKSFYPLCRATMGVVAGGGRVDKPFLKAGKKYFEMKSKNKLWPKTSGVSMNAVNHPYGGKRKKKGKPTIAPRNAPPGRKVGKIRPRVTGRAKR